MTGPPGESGDGSPGDPAERLRVAIETADVGATDLFDDVVSLSGIGDIDVVDGVATVTVTLPIPDGDLRTEVDRGIRTAAAGVDGVEEVRIERSPAAVDPGERVDLVPGVRNVVAVASGKGGVGKSTVATNVAAALADAGASVGILDADVYGPNAPTMLGLSDRTPHATADDEMVPREAHGVKVMSMDFVAGEDDPVIWRGPLVDEFIKQLFGDVAWGDLDYLVVDMPPGTGDAQLSLVQHLPVTGAVIVTTPQAVAVDDAVRGLTGFARYDVPVLGVVENMATFRCPDCGGVHEIFGEGGARDLREQFDVPVLGRIPLDPSVGTLSTEGDTGGGDDERRSVSIPLLGRLQVPRTREERERAGRRPPEVLRGTTGDAGRALRGTATRIAARVNAAALLRARDDFEAVIAPEHGHDGDTPGPDPPDPDRS